DIIILALLQGLTEFLPVSSSGHLVIGEAILGLKQPGITLEVFLHFGTFLSVLFIFRKDIWQMIISFFRKISHVSQWKDNYQSDTNFAMSIQIILGIIPAGIIGLIFKDFFEVRFNSLSGVGFALVFTGFLLFISHWSQEKKERLTIWGAIIIGIFQALAIIPGISRSGSTIASGMLMGFRREEVARFSFIMALPLVFGATILELKNVLQNDINWLMMGIGVFVAFISGYAAIKWLMRLLIVGKFSVFSYYCVIIGFIVLTFG
ncbi:MAG TPA: undecaprenyl-diphosphate phosphatase, partial [Candidatus Marinimicrobia bacterium]|nr:undecaprenyl-diphosphate phosphatase [Candidatus Neomarinimicrobiota bacterium]